MGRDRYLGTLEARERREKKLRLEYLVNAGCCGGIERGSLRGCGVALPPSNFFASMAYLLAVELADDGVAVQIE